MVRNKLGKGPISETAKLLNLSAPTVSKIVRQGPRTPKKKINKRIALSKVDGFTCDVVRREIYSFYNQGRSPSLEELLSHLQKKCSFPYKKTNLRLLLLKLGFKFRTLNKRRLIMESARIVAWRYRYLSRLNKLRAEGCEIVYLDETWYDTHDVPKKGWDDKSCSCCLKAPVSRGKRIMILHAGSEEGWVPNCLFLSAKNIGDAKADTHDDMNAQVFEKWFEHTLLKNLPRDKKCVIVLDNASYHSRLARRIPNMSTRIAEIVQFMRENDLTIPEPLPIKAVLVQIIKDANFKKEFVVDNLANKYGHENLRLPPYHCCLNPIELIWARLKTEVRKNNLTPSLSASVCNALRECAANINANLWSKCVRSIRTTERKYFSQDQSAEQFIINVGGSESEDDM